MSVLQAMPKMDARNSNWWRIHSRRCFESNPRYRIVTAEKRAGYAAKHSQEDLDLNRIHEFAPSLSSDEIITSRNELPSFRSYNGRFRRQRLPTCLQFFTQFSANSQWRDACCIQIILAEIASVAMHQRADIAGFGARIRQFPGKNWGMILSMRALR